MSTSTRPSALDIYERVVEDAAEEIERPNQSLAFSGLFAGFTIGAAPLAAALGLALLEGDGRMFIAFLLYPVGYAAVILGRAQFFTENTLYPVLLTFRDRTTLGPTLRLWAVVLSANLVGAALFTLLVTETSALDVSIRDELVTLGETDAAGGFGDSFWSAVMAGWILAMIAWLVEATDSSIARLGIIWALIVVVGLGGLDHCVASSIEVLSAVFDGSVGLDRFFGWLGTVTVGNILGGVFIVSVLNYGQIQKD